MKIEFSIGQQILFGIERSALWGIVIHFLCFQIFIVPAKGKDDAQD